MTSTDPTTTSAQPTGVDLARVALNAARAAAQRQGAETSVQRRPRRSMIIPGSYTHLTLPTKLDV
ncbi:hypothetical protein [Streptomyces albidoflavus]|uniref:hypothetical protein n=1 Tax=Streptomyces albidoflavus TaxID=1886 RepID=UPI000BB5FB3B|nr:hypothetical protein [Streptomyces albidoflavus]PBO30753.1 hypothetical protein CLM84_06660 [Streptomyces albidoflavus]